MPQRVVSLLPSGVSSALVLRSTRVHWLVLVMFSACNSSARISAQPCQPPLCAADAQVCPTCARTLPQLSITPSNPKIVITDDAPAELMFKVQDRVGGAELALSEPRWSLSAPLLGTIDAHSGRFRAYGDTAGQVEVQVSSDQGAFSTTLTIEIARDRFVDTSADAAAKFAAASPASDLAAPKVLYPLDGTMMPANITPPDIQWDDIGARGELFVVTLEKPGVRLRTFFRHDGAGFSHHLRPTDRQWHTLIDSYPEQPARVSVARLNSEQTAAASAKPLTVHFAKTVVSGAIYYWDLAAGRIQRIRPANSGPENFMPEPPTMITAEGKPSNCVACHTLSRDGNTLAVTVGGPPRAVALFDLRRDLSSAPAPTRLGPTTLSSTYFVGSLSPQTDYLVGSIGGAIRVVDTRDGGEIVSGGLPERHATYPVWSPDGSAIAYIANTRDAEGRPDNFMDLYFAADLHVVPMQGARAAGPPRQLLASEEAIARPSWSPDSRVLAFQQGPCSRSAHPQTGEAYPGAIRLIGADGASMHHLAALNGADPANFYPTFAPDDGGEHYWLAFFSRRAYGNAHVGTRGSRRRQIWVAAIDKHLAADADPSHPPFWLPQQDVTSHNLAAQWAPAPCSDLGQRCTASNECCSGICRAQGDQLPVCVGATAVQCRLSSESCDAQNGCCEGLQCRRSRCRRWTVE